MSSIGHSFPTIPADPYQNSGAAASSSGAGVANASGATVLPVGATREQSPGTASSSRPPRSDGPASHRDISNWLSSQAGNPAGSPAIYSPFEPSFSIEEALRRHAADRWDKKEDGLLPTMIYLKDGRTFYSLQFDDMWRNEGVLGEGRQGKVRIACRMDGQVVAVKKYHPDDDTPSSQDPSSSIRAAEVEYFIYGKLGEGSHFPKVHDIAHVEIGNATRSYLFMELIEGEDGNKVLEKISKGTLSKSEARTQIRKIARQYIEAVADMHDRGVASPDMNPGGFIHERSGNVKMIDFALAKYFPPEQLAQDGFDGFFEDRGQLGGILVDALGRALLGLRSIYAYEDEQHDDDALQDQFDQARQNEFDEALEVLPEDDEVRRDVETLRRFSGMLESGTSPRDLLNESYFTGPMRERA